MSGRQLQQKVMGEKQIAKVAGMKICYSESGRCRALGTVNSQVKSGQDTMLGVESSVKVRVPSVKATVWIIISSLAEDQGISEVHVAPSCSTNSTIGSCTQTLLN